MHCCEAANISRLFTAETAPSESGFTRVQRSGRDTMIRKCFCDHRVIGTFHTINIITSCCPIKLRIKRNQELNLEGLLRESQQIDNTCSKLLHAEGVMKTKKTTNIKKELITQFRWFLSKIYCDIVVVVCLKNYFHQDFTVYRYNTA